MTYETWTYHGVYAVDPVTTWRILVEKPEYGPTQRERVAKLRELTATDEVSLGAFGWGYDGGGPTRAAAAILADALDLGDVDDAGISMVAHPQNAVLVEMREQFCLEVVSQFCDEWRLGRTAILRWVHGWYTAAGVDVLPALVRDLPKAADRRR